jgi:hypothetical protein
MGLTGVPVYFINGKAVLGTNIPMINSLLKEAEEKKEPVKGGAKKPQTQKKTQGQAGR